MTDEEGEVVPSFTPDQQEWIEHSRKLHCVSDSNSHRHNPASYHLILSSYSHNIGTSQPLQRS